MNVSRSQFTRLLLVVVLAAAGAGLCALLMPAEQQAVEQHLIGFPDSDAQAHQARPFVIAGLCFLPALAALAYSFGGIFDRYITRQFLGIFGICIAALFLIWLLIDLSDNISEFRRSKHILRTMGTFYGTRLPAVLLLLLPYSLLLALLYALGRLSTNREIVAIIQSGRGVVRITLPLIIAGAFCTLLSLGLNFHWAPVAEGRQNDILADAGGRPPAEATNVLYSNPRERRLWMIGAFPPDYQTGSPLQNVEVTITDEHQRLQSRLTASQASWDRATRRWTFHNAVIGRYQPAPPQFLTLDQPLVLDSWSETPWQLIKPGLSAAFLGVPELNSWLQINELHSRFADPAPYLTQWHYRWALPFACLVTVFLATPLAIHFSRRGPGGGVFLAIMLSGLMLLLSSVVLAFGEAGSLPPAVAAWLPNASFAILGLYLFRRRITGRPIYHSLRRLLPEDDN